MKSNALTTEHAENRCLKSPDPCRSHSNATAGLILLGTVHSDPRGFSRTRAFLESHGPDLILVEISPFALQFRKERSSELRKTFLERLATVCQKLRIEPDSAMKHVQIASILRQIGIPFEYRASAAYAKSAAAGLIAVDYAEFSREWISTWPEMISAENIERLLELESAAPQVSSLYAQAARRIGSGSLFLETLPGGNTLRWQEREEYMAAEIISALEHFNPERPVYIGGWWHLSCGGGVKTLRELLGIGAASCLLLNRGAVLDRHSDTVTRPDKEISSA